LFDKLVAARVVGQCQDFKKPKRDATEIITKSFIGGCSFARNATRFFCRKLTLDKVHLVEYQHPIGKIAAFRQLFNVGPAVSGANEVINNQFYDYSDNATYEESGPSTRKDFSLMQKIVEYSSHRTSQ
jgi:penicillin amidase